MTNQTAQPTPEQMGAEATKTAILQSDQQQAELKTLAEAMAGYLSVLLGSDKRFTPMIGGNPSAVDELVSGAQQAQAAYRQYQEGRK